ncbi:MAG: DUF3800 domain-containing protein [Acidobacteria bacterium]|nr:MAG: DUF3800 domain-containing protein [Acidobacteriota bacterium]REK01698.1 MAG: DUF3800 domain-containing protein [Acidobacteriota bacterium]REK14654.1 MAG: DUF3800 domain-containing protein [Acidobacteriota bacterium]REK45369.1 MAG: DUF3800 domain-containing protein [Acidobacteriota bacterium]
MLSAYFDESGTDRSRSGTIVVAGYVSKVAKWEHFRESWLEVCRDEDVKGFHMTDLESCHKEFRGWTSDRKVRVLRRLHEIVKEYTLKDIDRSLEWKDYDELIQEYRAPNPPSAYGVLVNACLSSTGEWARGKGYEDPIEYFFESGNLNQQEVNECYRNAISDPAAKEAFLFGGLQFKRKYEAVELQAADFNAYESWKQLENRILQPDVKKMRRIRKSVLNLKGEVRETLKGVYSFHFDREGLREYLKEIEDADFDSEGSKPKEHE